MRVRWVGGTGVFCGQRGLKNHIHPAPPDLTLHPPVTLGKGPHPLACSGEGTPCQAEPLPAPAQAQGTQLGPVPRSSVDSSQSHRSAHSP